MSPVDLDDQQIPSVLVFPVPPLLPAALLVLPFHLGPIVGNESELNPQSHAHDSCYTVTPGVPGGPIGPRPPSVP